MELARLFRLTAIELKHKLEEEEPVYPLELDVRDAHRRRVFTDMYEFETRIQDCPEVYRWEWPVHIYIKDQEGRKCKKKLEYFRQLTFDDLFLGF